MGRQQHRSYEGVTEAFSSESENAEITDARAIVLKGKNALKGNGMEAFKRNLVQHVDILGIRQTSTNYNPNDEVQTVVLDNWTEEVLKFLALKTITGDNVEPCQLFPGYAIGVGWKALLVIPSVYQEVCIAMGNQNVFDHDPTDTASNKVQQKHRVKRYNATLRAYANFFDQQPPGLYWNFHKQEQQKEQSLYDKVFWLCNPSVFSDARDEEQNTDRGMSPSMPMLT